MMFLFLLKFSNQLVHSSHLEGFIGRVPEHELNDRGHYHPERGNLFSHLGVAKGRDLHPLRQVISHPQRIDYGKTAQSPRPVEG
jgi:hypothetical protein